MCVSVILLVCLAVISDADYLPMCLFTFPPFYTSSVRTNILDECLFGRSRHYCVMVLFFHLFLLFCVEILFTKFDLMIRFNSLLIKFCS